MLTETQIIEAFDPQWDLVLGQLEEGEEFSGNITKAAGQFFSQLGAPADHVDLMLAMFLSCPPNTKKDIIYHVASNNKDKILTSFLAHLKEADIEINTSDDLGGWIQYFFCIALVSKIAEVAKRMKEINHV